MPEAIELRKKRWGIISTTKWSASIAEKILKLFPDENIVLTVENGGKNF